jgi:hypothetical protein
MMLLASALYLQPAMFRGPRILRGGSGTMAATSLAIVRRYSKNTSYLWDLPQT